MAANPSRSLSPHDRQIILVAGFGHFLSHFDMLVFPALLLPLTTAWGLSLSQTLAVSFWQYLLFGITALPWGLVADRVGARPLLRLFYAGAAGAAILAGFWIDQPQKLVFALALLGGFAGIYHPVALGWISTEMEQVSKGHGYNGMFGNLGLAMGPLVTGLVYWGFGLKPVYFVVAAINAAGLVLMLFLKNDQAKAESSHGIKPTEGGSLMAPFLILLLAMMLGGIAYRGASVTVPGYLELKSGQLFAWLQSMGAVSISGNLVATVITSGIFIFSMLGHYIGGLVASHYNLKTSYLAFHLVPIPIALAMSRASDLTLVGLTLVYFFFLLGMQPIENTLVGRLSPERFRHSAFGLKFVLTFGVGSLAVKMVERVEAAAGIEQVFVVLALVSVVLVGAILGLIFYFSQQGKRAAQPVSA